MKQQSSGACSYTLAGLLELADISLPEDFGNEEREVAITGLQNKAHKVRQQMLSNASQFVVVDCLPARLPVTPLRRHLAPAKGTARHGATDVDAMRLQYKIATCNPVCHSCKANLQIS